MVALLRPLFLFALVPLAELATLVWIADKTNRLIALAFILGPAILGGWLTRVPGVRCWRAFHGRIALGKRGAGTVFGDRDR